MAGSKRSFVTLQIYSNNLGFFGPNLVQINVFEGFRAMIMAEYASGEGQMEVFGDILLRFRCRRELTKN